jgi:twinkle protein
MNWEDIGVHPKGKTGKFITTCPKCSGDRKKKNIPCLTVNDEVGNRWWHCNHCTFSGNLDIYEKQQERINKVYSRSRMPQVLPELYTKDVIELLCAPKGLSMATLKKRGIYEIPPLPGESKACIAFPFKKRGILVNVKFRRLDYDRTIALSSGEERYLSKNWQIKKEDGAEVAYWGLDHLDFTKSKDLLITEGETDLLTWVECGLDESINLLSVPNGAINANDKDIQDKLAFALDPWVIENVYAKAERVFLATDDDAPGHRLREELSAIIGKDKCFIVKYKGRKDVNEVLVGDAGKDFDPLGKKGVLECFEDAFPYPIKGIMTIDHALDKLMMMANQEEQKGFIIGDAIIDNYISLKPNLLVTVTGIPSHGKTSWWRWYEAKQTMKNSLKWAKFVPDSRPVEREYARIAEIIVGKRWEKNKPWSMSEEQRKRAIDFVRTFYVIVVPDEKNIELIKALNGKNVGSQTLDSLFWYFETLKKQHNIFGYNIDAWNKIDHQRPKDLTEEAYIGKALDSILKFNQNFELMASIIAHPTKLERKDPNYEPPDLYNIKGSSAWYEKTDIGITSYRRKFEKKEIGKEGKRTIYKWVRNNKFPTDILVTKMKFDELGKEGDFPMFMDWYHSESFVHEMPKYYNSVGDNETKAEFVKADAGSAQAMQAKIEGLLESPEEIGDDLAIDDLPF